MSRGYGKIQRGILELFEKNPNRTPESYLIAAYVFEANPISKSQVNSINRALKKLVEAGEIEDLGYNYLGRKHYGLPDRNKRFKWNFCSTDLAKKVKEISSNNT